MCPSSNQLFIKPIVYISGIILVSSYIAPTTIRSQMLSCISLKIINDPVKGRDQNCDWGYFSELDSCGSVDK